MTFFFRLLIFSYGMFNVTDCCSRQERKKHRPENGQINIFSGHRKINQRARNADVHIAYARYVF